MMSVIAVTVTVIVMVMMATAFGSEFAAGAHIAVAGQDLPFVFASGLQVVQEQEMVRAAAAMIRRLPFIMAIRNPVTHQVCAFCVGDPLDLGRVIAHVKNSGPVHNADSSLRPIHLSQRGYCCAHTHQQPRKPDCSFHGYSP